MPKKTKRQSTAQVTTEQDIPNVPGLAYALKALVLENGSCPVEDWIKSLRDVTTRQRIQVRLDRIERGNLGDCGPVGEGVSEFRLMFGAGYRIYYAMTGTSVIVLLIGGDKSSQDKDIAQAKTWWKDYKDDTQRYERDLRR